MKIYTGFGDKGETSLAGGKKVSKDHWRVQLYGTLDELNSFIGLLIIKAKGHEVVPSLIRIQNEIFILSTELSTPPDSSKNFSSQYITNDHILTLENEIDKWTDKLVPLKNFILPGGSEPAANAQIARTICRRAERELISGGINETIRDVCYIYLNRLGDWFFTLARYLNLLENVEDIPWLGLRKK